MSKTCVHGYATGRVQGVWFRGFVRDQAARCELQGWARNLADGRVEILLCGEPEQIAEALKQIHIGPRLARVDELDMRSAPYDAQVQGFQVL